jgi:predicted O-methyltransferase YrrM
MRLEELRPLIERVPYVSPQQGRILYEHIRRTRPAEVLELGFAHGASSCYIAAALAENGHGRLTTVDLEETRGHFRPSIEELLERTALARWVDVRRERTSYTWFLKKKVEERSQGAACRPLYDFCYVDGSKNWTIDGLAFFLVDKLLNEGAWLLFDDLKWSYRMMEQRHGLRVSDGIVHRELGEDELATPHVELIFRLLVMQHPDYGEFRIEDDNWAWARKVRRDHRTLLVDTRLSARTLVYKLAWPLRRLIHYDG